MIEPTYTYYLVAGGRLPHGLDASDIGTIRTTSGKEDSTIANLKRNVITNLLIIY